MWQMICWKVSLLLWIFCSSCQSYCWSSWWNCMQETVSNAFRNTNAASNRETSMWLTSGWWGIDPILWWCCRTSECLQGSCLQMHKFAFPSSPAFPEVDGAHVIKMGQGTKYERQTTAFNRQYPKKPNNCVSKLCNTKCVTCFNWTPTYRFLFAYPSHTTWTKRAVAGRIVAKRMLTSRLKISTKTIVWLYPSTYIFKEMHKGELNCWIHKAAQRLLVYMQQRCCLSKNCHWCS